MRFKNKKGNADTVILVGIIIGAVILIGLALAIGSFLYKETVNPIVDGFKGIGSIDTNTNVTEITENSVGFSTDLGNRLKWMTGVIYFILLLGCLGFSFYLRGDGDKITMIFFFSLMLLLFLISILISNSYQDMYTAGDDLGDYLHETSLLSWLILNSPLIIIALAILCGVIIFSGGSEDVYA